MLCILQYELDNNHIVFIINNFYFSLKTVTIYLLFISFIFISVTVLNVMRYTVYLFIYLNSVL